MLGKLILTRHGESVMNARGVWTGITDAPLTDKGRRQAAQMGEAIADVIPSAGFSSALIRAQDTLKIALAAIKLDIPLEFTPALNERDYGDLTGLNKWDVQKKYGNEKFTQWRRSWNYPVPGGETLENVSSRSLPYFEQHILPLLTTGKTVIITAHGNTLRALIKNFDNIDDKSVESLEIPFGQIVLYDFDANGSPGNKSIRQIETTPTNA